MKKIFSIFLFLFFFTQNAFALFSYHERQHLSKKEPKQKKDKAEVLFENAQKKGKIEDVIEKLNNVILKYPDSSSAAKAQLEIGKYHYLSSDFRQAIIDFGIFLNKYYSSPLLDQAYYYAGLSYLALTDKDNAHLCLDKIIYDIGRPSSLYEWAHMAKGDVYFKSDDCFHALKEYQASYDNVIDTSILSSLYYKMGIVYQKQGLLEKAKSQFDAVKEKYPLSNEMLLIKNIAIAEFFYIQAGCFGSLQNASNFQEGLTKKGYEAYMSETPGDNFYRVLIGKFKNKSDALDVLKKLEQKEKIKGKLMP